jgi:hypothetical protein
MSEVIDVLSAFGSPLKLAWVGWIAWGVGQYFWFRHERSMPVRKVTSVAKPTAKRPAAPKTIAAQAAEAPVVGRLITPAHVAADAGKPVPAPIASRPQPEPVAVPSPSHAAVSEEPVAPPFDPSMAVIEQFGASNDSVLDRFVRDFEMQDAGPRRRRTRVRETLSFGAEAPPAP